MLFSRVHAACHLCRATDATAVDEKDGSLVCTECGCVIDAQYEWCENSRKAHTHGKERRMQNMQRSYIPYNRLYHFNERLAQRNAVEPRVPRNVINAIGKHFGERGVDTAILDSSTICSELRRRGWKRYCERWVQVKYRITCEDEADYDTSDAEYPNTTDKKPRGEDRRVAAFAHYWPHQWLNAEALFAFKYFFIRVSECFDRKFFKAGRRYTHKCTVFNASPGTKLARHNLVCHTPLAIQIFHFHYRRHHQTRTAFYTKTFRRNRLGS